MLEGVGFLSEENNYKLIFCFVGFLLVGKVVWVEFLVFEWYYVYVLLDLFLMELEDRCMIYLRKGKKECLIDLLEWKWILEIVWVVYRK